MKKMFAIVLALMLCVSVLSVSAFAAEGKTTVHAKVPADWTAPNAYGWVDRVGNPSWPGDAMTANGEWWDGSIDATNDRIIINNNDGTSGPQTSDITIEAGKEIWLVVSQADDGSYSATVSYTAPGDDVTPPEDETPKDETPKDETPKDEPAPAGDYYVAGSEGLCGVEWVVDAAENKMTYANGVYSITFKNVPAGNYSFKVTQGDWNKENWGGTGENGNFDFENPVAGDVTIEFNANTKAISVTDGGGNKTGDVSLAAVSVALLAATAGLVVVVSKKKEF